MLESNSEEEQYHTTTSLDIEATREKNSEHSEDGNTTICHILDLGPIL
jgi:hypothetical protein